MKKHSFLVMLAGFLCGSVCFLLIFSMVSESVQLRAQNEELQTEIERLTDGNAQQKTEIARLQTALAAEMAPLPNLIEETDFYRIVSVPNPDRIVVETRKRLVDWYETIEHHGWSDQGPSDESVRTFGSNLIQIDGVVKICFDNYSLTIVKAEMYRWEELLPSIRPLLEVQFGGESVEEIGAVPEIGAT